MPAISRGRVCRDANQSHHRPAAGVKKKRVGDRVLDLLTGGFINRGPLSPRNFHCCGGVHAALPITLKTGNNTVRQQETMGTDVFTAKTTVRKSKSARTDLASNCLSTGSLRDREN